MLRLAATLAILAATTTLSSAQTIDDAITSFIHAKGFTHQNPYDLEEVLSGHFIDDSITPGGAVGPIEKAMLIAEDGIPSNRTRTFIAYGEILENEDGASVPYSFIEVRHYNFGPIIHAEAVEAYGEKNTDTVEAFGTGEHMAWRFVFRPIMGHAATLLDASNRVISDQQAERHDCNCTPCLQPYNDFDDLIKWEEIDGALPEWPLLISDQSDEIATPAFAISQLAALGFWANAESGNYQWTGGEHPEAADGYEPYRFISIDRNLGQEIAIDTMWRETLLNDDSISELLLRHIDVAGSVFLMRGSVAR
jgi:hypothetical protein